MALDWQKNILTEPSVALALRDICLPGDLVLDVGSHVGSLALQMSRLVGPYGRVIAIEANPFTAEHTTAHLVRNGCANAMVINRAVTRTTGLDLEFHLLGGPEGGVGDSLFGRSDGAAKVVRVKSVALDDLIEGMQLEPAFLKFDIEGAEWDALCGMTRTIGRLLPTMILEQTRETFNCVELLLEFGYVAIDLARYARIREVADYGVTGGVRNLLFIHPSRLDRNPALAAFLYPEVEPLADATSGRLESAQDVELTGIQPGRYYMETRVECAADTEIKVGIVDQSGEWMSMIHGMGSNGQVRAFALPFFVPHGAGGSSAIRVQVVAGPADVECDVQLFHVVRPGLPSALSQVVLG